MKIRDEALWQQQRAEFAQDPNPLATDFERFVITWADLAEGVIERSHQVSYSSSDFGDEVGHIHNMTPIEALRATLRDAERQAGYWSIGFLGQAILTLMGHWGEIPDQQALERFGFSLTTIEHNVVNDTAKAWEAERQKEAAERGE